MIVMRARSVNGVQCADAPSAAFDEFGGSIGRASDNFLVLPDARHVISPIHAVVVFRAAGYFIVARGAEPTLLNGRVLERDVEHRLQPGDTIQIGGYLLEVSAPDVSPDECDPFAELFGHPVGAPAPFRPPSIPDDWDPFSPSPVKDIPGSGDGAGSAPAVLVPDAAPLGIDELFGLGSSPSESALERPSLTLPSPTHRDDVRLGAASPRAVERGAVFLVHFCTYPAGQEEAVRESLARQSPNAISLLGKRSCRWAAGTPVTVSLSAEDLQCEEPVQTFSWNGAVEILDFALRVSTHAALGDRIVTFKVMIGPVVVATLRMSIAVAAAARAVPHGTVYGRSASSGFASYSARDRELVSHLVGAIGQSTGIDLFYDCLDLRPSELWKPQLARQICQRDLFLLFWSREARSSSWVEWEWRTALREKGLPSIQIHPLQPNVDPPAELSALHFGSVHALVAEYERGRTLRSDA